MKNVKQTFYAMRHDRDGKAVEVDKITASNIDAALRQAKKKLGREVEYVTTRNGLEFRR